MKTRSFTKPFQLIMGKNCIAEVLKACPERIIEVYVGHPSKEEPLYKALVTAGIRILETSKKKLSQLVDSESHQSYVAAVKNREQVSIKTFLKEHEGKKQSLVLMLDSIYDPQNLGAIIRAAECFGVDLVIYSKNRGADITPVATKTSAGASELVPISKVSNLVETLKAFQQAEYWAVAAAVGDQSQSLYKLKFPEKAVIVMGSEGKGIQPILSKTCDFHVSIPMQGNIDSLNVSQATAVLLNSYRNSFTLA